MIKRYIFVDGQPVCTVSLDIENVPENERHKYIEVGPTDEAHMFYVKNGELLRKTPRPAEFYEFDIVAEQWLPNLELLSCKVRLERNAKLSASDWTQLPDAPLETKDAWAAYRQALRDIPAQPGFPESVVWPTPPV